MYKYRFYSVVDEVRFDSDVICTNTTSTAVLLMSGLIVTLVELLAFVEVTQRISRLVPG